MRRHHLLSMATLMAALVGACLSAEAATGANRPGAPAATSASSPASPAATVIVTRDAALLRAAPNASATVLTTLWRGEWLELRGERGDYLQVWDHHRERGGYIASSLVHRIGAEAADAPALMAVLGFISEQASSEPLALALAAAAIQALPADQLNGPAGARLLESIGRQAERLAERASAIARPQDSSSLSAHLDIAARHGVRLLSRTIDGAEARVLLCYDGDAWRRLLQHRAASVEQRARATLALTRTDCDAADASPREREGAQQQRAALLAQVARVSDAPLPPHLLNRVLMRRAVVQSSLAFAAARRGDDVTARSASEQATQDLARVLRTELLDEDASRYTEAALRVNAVRWASSAAGTSNASSLLAIQTTRHAEGQTCVALIDPRWKDGRALAQRCTWGQVWAASATVSREGNALALAVQPTDGWRELWLFRKAGSEWTVQVLPPAPANPGIGYAEFAGWVPGGQQMLVAREAIAEGRTLRRFELIKLDTLNAERQGSDAAQLGAFNRWSDAAWKRDSLALR